jgi:hypothetical protein
MPGMKPVSVTTVRASACVQYDASDMARFGDWLARHHWPEMVEWRGLTAYAISLRRDKKPMGMIFDDGVAHQDAWGPTILRDVGK